MLAKRVIWGISAALLMALNLGCPSPAKSAELSARETAVDEGPREPGGRSTIADGAAPSTDWTKTDEAEPVRVAQAGTRSAAPRNVAIDAVRLGSGDTVQNIALKETGSVAAPSERVAATVSPKAAGLDTPYWPLAAGNSWTFGVPLFIGPEGEGEGEAKSNTPILTMSVAREFEIKGVPVFEILFELPDGGGVPAKTGAKENPFLSGLALPIGPLAQSVGDGGLGSVSKLLAKLPSEGSLPLSRLTSDLRPKTKQVGEGEGEGEVPGAPTLSLFLTRGVDGYYAAFTEARLEAKLPATAGLLSWDAVLTSLPKVIQGIEGGLYEQAGADVEAIVGAAWVALEPLGPALEIYVETEGAPDRIIALSVAVGADLDSFESQNPVADALAAVIATSAGGADDIKRFVDGLIRITETTLVEVEDMGPALDEYLSTLESPAPIINLLRAFEDRFDGYTNSDIVVQDFARFLAADAGGLAAIIESLDNGDYTLEDPDLLAYLEALGKHIDLALDEESEVPLEPLAQLDDLIRFAGEQPASGPASIEFKAIILDVLRAARLLVADTLEADPENFDPNDLDDLTNAALTLFNLLADTDPENILASYLAEVALLIDEVVNEIVAIYPWVEALAQDIETLGNALDNFTPQDFEPGEFGAIFEAISESTDNYSRLHGDVMAEATSIVTGAVADSFRIWDDLHNQLEAIPLSREQGELASFLPLTLVKYPFQIDKKGIKGLKGPLNEDCANASAVTAGASFAGATTGSIDGAVWHSFTPAATGIYRFSTCYSDYDTYLHVYAGTCSARTYLAEDDDSAECFRASLVQLVLDANTTYLVQVSGFDGDTGNYVLSIEGPIILAPGDDCTTALPVPLGVETFGSTLDSPDGYVWHSFTPEVGGMYSVAMNSDDDGYTYVYGGTCEGLVYLTNTYAWSQPAWVDLAANQTYYFRVDDYGSTLGYSLLVDGPFEPVPNNDCETALPISLGVESTGSTVDSPDGYKWHSFTPAVDGVYSVTIASEEGYVTVLGGVCEDLYYIGESYSWSVPVGAYLAANQTYYLRVYDYLSALGYSLLVEGPTVPAPGEYCASALPISLDIETPGSTIGSPGGYVWHSFTPEVDGLYSVTMSGPDGYVYIYDGTCFQLHDIANTDPFYEPAMINLVANQMYYLEVYDYGNELGYSLRVEGPILPGPGELCTTAVPLSPGVETSGSTLGTLEGFMWHSFTPEVDGLYSVTMNGTDGYTYIYDGTCEDFYTVSYVYAGDGPETLDLIGGQTVYLRVVDYGTELGYSLLVEGPIIPGPTEVCAMASPVSLGVEVTGSLAGTLAGEAWYTFVPTATGVYGVSLCGSPYETYMDIYSGTCDNLRYRSRVYNYGCEPASRSEVYLFAGTTYYLEVYDYYQESDSFAFTIDGPLPGGYSSALVYNLPDFGVGNLTDTVASIARITPALGAGSPRDLPYMILARNVGPAFFFGMTLQSFVVAGGGTGGLPTSAAIDGSIVDENGDAVTCAAVRVMAVSGDAQEFVVPVNDRGEFTLSNLPVDSLGAPATGYRLEFYAVGLTYPGGQLNVGIDDFSEFPPVARASLGPITLTPGSGSSDDTVTGRVTDTSEIGGVEFDVALSGVRVEVLRDDLPLDPPLFTFTCADGRFELAGIPGLGAKAVAGLSLQFSAPDYEDKVAPVTEPGEDFPVILDKAFIFPFTVSGVVAKANGDPVAAAQVTVQALAGTLGFNIETNDDGLFGAELPDYGDYSIKVVAPGFEPLEQTFTISTTNQNVTVSVGLDVPGGEGEGEGEGETPAITGFNPKKAEEAGGETITITGTNLAAATAVTLAGINATITGTPSATEIVVTAGPADAGTRGPVIVTTPAGVATSTADFDYVKKRCSFGSGASESAHGASGDLVALVFMASVLAMPRLARRWARAHGDNR